MSSKQVYAADFVLCRSDKGGGWSLHAPGSTDEDIATGNAPYLVHGTAIKISDNNWTRPNCRDYARALRVLKLRQTDALS